MEQPLKELSQVQNDLYERRKVKNDDTPEVLYERRKNDDDDEVKRKEEKEDEVTVAYETLEHELTVAYDTVENELVDAVLKCMRLKATIARSCQMLKTMKEKKQDVLYEKRRKEEARKRLKLKAAVIKREAELQPTTSTVQPTTSTVQPTTTTVQLTASTAQPTTSTAKPTTSTTQSTTSTAQPTTSTIQPTTSTVQPTTSTAQPTTSTAQPTTSTAQPTTSTAQPTTSTAQPTTSTAQPTTSTAQPTTSTAQPTTLTAQTTTSTATPTTSTVMTTTHQPLQCPKHWVLFEQSCYYFFAFEAFTWNEAKNDCLERSAHLVTIETSREQNFLKQYLDPLVYNVVHTDFVTGVWIGGTDRSHNHVFEWYNILTNQYKPMAFTSWIPGEPNHVQSSHVEHCMSMEGGDDFNWMGDRCSHDKYHVCETQAIGANLSSSTLSPMVVTTTAKPALHCPRYWTLYDHSCYWFSVNDGRTWYEARDYCDDKSANLVWIETSQENTFLRHRLDPLVFDDIDSKDDPYTGVWTGGHDRRSDGEWQWFHAQTHQYTPVTYTHWSPGEPDYAVSDDEEHCLALEGNDGFKWQSASCRLDKYVVCEKPALKSSHTGSILIGK
ncbi:hypothetical protein ACF0H5_015610 [Mactra antiquata]